MHTSSWPLFAGGFGPIVRALSSAAASFPLCGANILTFLVGGFDAGCYHMLVTHNVFHSSLHVWHLMHTCTWEASLVDFAFLVATTGSTDLACFEGAINYCFLSLSVLTYDL